MKIYPNQKYTSHPSYNWIISFSTQPNKNFRSTIMFSQYMNTLATQSEFSYITANSKISPTIHQPPKTTPSPKKLPSPTEPQSSPLRSHKSYFCSCGLWHRMPLYLVHNSRPDGSLWSSTDYNGEAKGVGHPSLECHASDCLLLI